jgi:SAM-dependent methyltransferase
MWDSGRDLAIWETIAQEAHARHSRTKSTYVRLLSGVEEYGHRFIANKAAGTRRVLEIGVGGGEHLVYRLPAAGTERYVGLDICPAYAEICRAKFGIEVVVADAAKLPFDDSSFDCVIAMAILEHVHDLESVLSEVNRVLEPGGRLLALVPTNGSVAVGLFKMLITYPTMRFRGIRRPDLVWNYLNVNSFKRVRSLLIQRFPSLREAAIPTRLLPWWLSPVWAFVCTNPKAWPPKWIPGESA